MSMLAFFPWLKIEKIEKEIDLGDVRLVRFLRGHLPDDSQGRTQAICDRILKPYVSRDDEPIEESTLVLLKDKDILEDFDEEERIFLFSLAEIIAFSGLAKREYFKDFGLKYCNRDDFSFVIQQFSDDSDGILIATRRRDGSKKEYVDENNYRVMMPFHINYEPVNLDVPLISSLLNAQKDQKINWQLYSDAIFNFNRANTDSDQISEHQEVVLIISAFERILDCNKGNEDELVEKFLGVFKPYEDIDVTKSTRVKNSKYKGTNKTLREIWLRDLFQLRGDYAHGKRLSKRPCIWKSYEHLLLGSYVFPLLVKCKLAENGFYKLSSDDIFDINVFEELADADLFDKPQNQRRKSIVNSKWNMIRQNWSLKHALGEAKKSHSSLQRR